MCLVANKITGSLEAVCMSNVSIYWKLGLGNSMIDTGKVKFTGNWHGSSSVFYLLANTWQPSFHCDSSKGFSRKLNCNREVC